MLLRGPPSNAPSTVASMKVPSPEVDEHVAPVVGRGQRLGERLPVPEVVLAAHVDDRRVSRGVLDVDAGFGRVPVLESRHEADGFDGVPGVPGGSRANWPMSSGAPAGQYFRDSIREETPWTRPRS
jgi:hypothetical protein